VVRYDAGLGYFQTEGMFAGARYIPFSAIERVGTDGAYLNVTKSFVHDVYAHMPAVYPTLKNGKTTGEASISDRVTRHTLSLNAPAVNAVREHIGVGTNVFDAENKRVGTVDAYDRRTGYMRIQKAGLSSKDVFLPVTTVSYLDDRGVHLRETKDELATRF